MTPAELAARFDTLTDAEFVRTYIEYTVGQMLEFRDLLSDAQSKRMTAERTQFTADEAARRYVMKEIENASLSE